MEFIVWREEFSVGIQRIDEAMLAKHGYPAAAEHAAEPRRIVGELTALKADRFSSPSLLSHETMEFLRDWLGTHVLGADKAYAPFFEAKGEK